MTLIIEKIKLLIKISFSQAFLWVFKLGSLTGYESAIDFHLLAKTQEGAFCQEIKLFP